MMDRTYKPLLATLLIIATVLIAVLSNSVIAGSLTATTELKGVTIETIDDGTVSPNATCCNTCPTPKIIVVPKYTTIKVPIRIPYPVLKPIPPHHDDDEVKKCPKDYQFVAPNKCTKTVIVKKQEPCPVGFVRIDEEKCLRIVIIRNQIPPTKVVCPPGFTPFVVPKNSTEYLSLKDLETNTTTNSYIIKKEIDNNVLGCKKDKVVHIEDNDLPHFTCPKGYYYQAPFHCVKTVECPKKGGWVKLTDGRCVRTLFKCPKGTKKVGRYGLTCIKISLPCPKGYRQSKRNPGLCLKTKIIIKIKCPSKKMFYSQEKKKCILKKCKSVKCQEVKCPKGEQPVLNQEKSCCPVCKPCVCSAEYHPVCTRDGVTVYNLCTAKCLGLDVKYEGECRIIELEKILKICPPCYDCEKVKRRPVCGTDGVTYPNVCTAKCLTSGKFSLKKKGECSDLDCVDGEAEKKINEEFLPFFEKFFKAQQVSKQAKKE